MYPDDKVIFSGIRSSLESKLITSKSLVNTLHLIEYIQMCITFKMNCAGVQSSKIDAFLEHVLDEKLGCFVYLDQMKLLPLFKQMYIVILL